MNNSPIKCAYCGKFIAYSSLEEGKSKCVSEVSFLGQESEWFECEKCINE